MARIKSLIPDLDLTDKYECQGLYFGGYSAEDIARDTGVNINTLKDWIKTGKWIDRRRKIVAAELKRKPPEERPVGKMLAAQKSSFVERFVAKTGAIAAQDAEYWHDEMDPLTRLQHAPNIAALNKAHRSNLDLDKEEIGERGHISLTFLNSPDSVRILDVPAVKQLEEPEA